MNAAETSGHDSPLEEVDLGEAEDSDDEMRSKDSDAEDEDGVEDNESDSEDSDDVDWSKDVEVRQNILHLRCYPHQVFA